MQEIADKVCITFSKLLIIKLLYFEICNLKFTYAKSAKYASVFLKK